MSLPTNAPSTPPSGNSPASDESSNAPRTPLSPSSQAPALPHSAEQPVSAHNQQSPNGSNAATAQAKRKPSRRANTAERRATHNAVERQRRETLNGRFLDLAALLPNLSQIRRPSKSSIVNSSIAHIHASRRHRLLASRELRSVKSEADALRRELNEWRDRAGLPRVEEPVRGDGFAMILSGEIEVLAAVIDEDDENAMGYDGFEDGDDEYAGPVSAGVDDGEDLRSPLGQPNGSGVVKNTNAFVQSMPAQHHMGVNNHLPHILPRPAQHGPMVASVPATVSYENPAMASMYEPQVLSHSMPFPVDQYMTPVSEDFDKLWYPPLQQVANSQQMQHLQAQRSMVGPPSGIQGMVNSGPSPVSGNALSFADPTNAAYFAPNLQRQQQMTAMQQHGGIARGHLYASPIDGDDASSVGSGRSGRERSGSSSNGSGYGSPAHASSHANYDVPNMMAGSHPGDYGMPKRMNSSGLHINTSVAGPWGANPDVAVDGMAGMVMKQTLGSPITVGGGNGGSYGMMM